MSQHRPNRTRWRHSFNPIEFIGTHGLQSLFILEIDFVPIELRFENATVNVSIAYSTVQWNVIFQSYITSISKFINKNGPFLFQTHIIINLVQQKCHIQNQPLCLRQPSQKHINAMPNTTNIHKYSRPHPLTYYQHVSATIRRPGTFSNTAIARRRG